MKIFLSPLNCLLDDQGCKDDTCSMLCFVGWYCKQYKYINFNSFHCSADKNYVSTTSGQTVSFLVLYLIGGYLMMFTIG